MLKKSYCLLKGLKTFNNNDVIFYKLHVAIIGDPNSRTTCKKATVHVDMLIGLYIGHW